MSSARVLIAAGCLFAAEPAARCDSEPTVAELRERVLRAKDRSEGYTAYKEDFKRLGRSGLLKAMKDTDTGIVLQAAWEVHKKPVKRPRPIPDSEDETCDPAEMAKFVTFLKDRTKAPVPDWWARLLLDTDLILGKYHTFPTVRAVAPTLRKSKAGYLVPDAADLVKDGERLVYTAGGRLVAFDPEDVTYFLTDLDRFAGLLGEKRAVIACYSDIPVGFQLAAFARGGGKPIWRTTVWALYHEVARTGPEGPHRAELREVGGVVYVFGASVAGMYMEAFEAATGKCRFRFNTAYWGNHSERQNE